MEPVANASRISDVNYETFVKNISNEPLITKLQKKIQVIKDQIETFKNDQQSTNNLITTLNTQLKSELSLPEITVNRIYHERQKAQVTKASLTNDIKNTNDELVRAQVELDYELNFQQKDLNAIKDEVTRLQEELKGLANERMRFEKSIDEADDLEAIKELRQKITDLEHDKCDLEARIRIRNEYLYQAEKISVSLEVDEKLDFLKKDIPFEILSAQNDFSNRIVKVIVKKPTSSCEYKFVTRPDFSHEGPESSPNQENWYYLKYYQTWYLNAYLVAIPTDKAPVNADPVRIELNQNMIFSEHVSNYSVRVFAKINGEYKQIVSYKK